MPANLALHYRCANSTQGGSTVSVTIDRPRTKDETCQNPYCVVVGACSCPKETQA